MNSELSTIYHLRQSLWQWRVDPSDACEVYFIWRKAWFNIKAFPVISPDATLNEQFRTIIEPLMISSRWLIDP
jgi:hypothetical protein